MASNEEIKLNIFRDLYNKGEGIYVYTIPGRYKIRIPALFKLIHKYRDVIEYHNGKIQIIDGKKEIFRKRFFPRNLNKEVSGCHIIPSTYIGKSIGIDDLYCPSYLTNSQEEPAF